MLRARYYQRAWDVLIVTLAIMLAAIVVLWAGKTAGDEPTEPKMELVVSPWEGVFRVAPQPEAEPFVEVGSNVTPDTVVGLINLDVMRPAGEIEIFAGDQGTVMQVLVGDGAYVQAGQPLVVIRLDPPDTLVVCQRSRLEYQKS